MRRLFFVFKPFSKPSDSGVEVEIGIGGDFGTEVCRKPRRTAGMHETSF